jgi:hypothetical protein
MPMCVHLLKKQPALRIDWSDVARVTTDMLPDIALLEIFDFYVDKASIEAWHALVHVCRKWRNIVFGAPRRLNLRLCCGPRTRVRELLDIWPPLPIVIAVYFPKVWNMDNIDAALEHNDRICQLDLTGIPSSLSEKVLAATQRPFPSLRNLELVFENETAPVDPDLFLGGSAPSLQSLFLNFTSVPGLPNLLLSATHLVNLSLHRIPDSGYISTEAMLTALSALTKLKNLAIVFVPPQGRPDRKSRHPHPQTRILLPSLTMWRFRGFSDYLEELVARVDAPLLDNLYITFFPQPIFDTPELTRFISRTPKFKTHDELEASMVFSEWGVSVRLDGALKLAIVCGQSDHGQLASLAQICGSVFPHDLIFAVKDLYILGRDPEARQQNDIENGLWLELLRQFTAVRGLYISREFAPHIAPVLRELDGERATEVLPALRILFSEETPQTGPVQEAFGPFVAARKSSSHPIAVSRWERGFDD